MLRSPDDYAALWDGRAPEPEERVLAGGFPENLRRIEQDGAWGSLLEVTALAKELGRQIWLFRNDEAWRFHSAGRGQPLTLAFDEGHYESMRRGGLPPALGALERSTQPTRAPWDHAIMLRGGGAVRGAGRSRGKAGAG